jgi:hypothetical protein
MLETISGILKYWWIKILATIPLCLLSFSSQDTEIIWGIIYIVVFDTILGMWVAFKYKKFTSSRMAKFANKVGVYGLAMMSIWVLSAVEPTVFGWGFRYVGIFIILTEVLSNFEKLALLGFKNPTKFLSLLNSKFKELYDVENGKKKEIAETIIDNHK